MCNLSMSVEAKGVEKGIQQGILQSILNLMESMKWSTEQAMNALQIPPEEQALYSSQINPSQRMLDYLFLPPANGNRRSNSHIITASMIIYYHDSKIRLRSNRFSNHISSGTYHNSSGGFIYHENIHI